MGDPEAWKPSCSEEAVHSILRLSYAEGLQSSTQRSLELEGSGNRSTSTPCQPCCRAAAAPTSSLLALDSSASSLFPSQRGWKGPANTQCLLQLSLTLQHSPLPSGSDEEAHGFPRVAKFPIRDGELGRAWRRMWEKTRSCRRTQAGGYLAPASLAPGLLRERAGCRGG